MVGIETDDKRVPLLPICHTTQMAQVEITIDGMGKFRQARVVLKSEARTIIPCNEKSGSRTSGEAAHPLCDKLQYIAGDYLKHGGSKSSYYASYLKELETWCHSSCAHPKVQAVFEYVHKGNVVNDLIAAQVLIADERGILIAKPEKKKGEIGPKIFDVLNAQEDAFVRWVVETPYDLEPRVWRDKTLWDCWIRYYLGSRQEKALCLVTGEEVLATSLHPAKIRNDGDKAKLISSNDNQGYTFRGRFTRAEQAAAVGLEASQKAHGALRWLISRQGYSKGDLSVVAWAVSGAKIPQPTDDLISLLGVKDLSNDEQPSSATAQELALKLKRKIAGYGKEIGNTAGVVVMAVDSATPGRLSIIYYRELSGSDFLQRINDWHETCAWLHKYGTVSVIDTAGGKPKTYFISFIGAPAPADIAEAAYGRNADDRLKQATITRLLTCIIDAQPLPRDLMESAVRRACNRVAMEKWEWSKTLSIACSLFRKYNKKENYEMSLDPNRTTRDYLYGRLLALADSLEEWALNTGGEKRDTNAARLMQRFAEHPFSTWRTIELALGPYKARLGGKSKKRQRMIDEVVAAFQGDDFISDKRLSGEFLLGYHCQREHLRGLADASQDSEDEGISNS
jgi:CRISPR-associated protein Csd1